ncbi:unnamed protein product [Meloidogyne enterolobii]|uniref:Uncharacterized protein n=1 Tax=Meloidogyne enterolobii TaxID=390850 RepID=A0ACB0YM92_MELEN
MLSTTHPSERKAKKIVFSCINFSSFSSHVSHLLLFLFFHPSLGVYLWNRFQTSAGSTVPVPNRFQTFVGFTVLVPYRFQTSPGFTVPVPDLGRFHGSGSRP